MDRKIIYSFGENRLKLNIKRFTILNDGKSIRIVTLDNHGEKRELLFTVVDQELRGPFYSKYGFINESGYSSLGQDTLGNDSGYLYHKFTRE
ncbi:MAG: hypothetical protein EP333_06855 [Bacteroidetes bacterium]|nr:MAG: hypothetical protein EP333_06855 [Bacteroidota bacterium]